VVLTLPTKEQGEEMTAKEMSDYRLPNRLQNHANGLEVVVILFVDYLHNCVKSVNKNHLKAIEIILHNCVKSVENSLQNLHNCAKSVNDLQGENSENGSKTAFSAISSENSASRGEGGLGGGVLNPSNSTSNCTVTDVNSTINLKEKNTKKRKENLQNCVKSVKPYSDDFEKVWSFYPRHAGTSKSKAWESFQKLEENRALPELNFLIAVLFFEKKRDQWQEETKIPHLTTWLNQKRWEGYDSPEDKAKVNRKYNELCGTIWKPAAPVKVDLEKEEKERTAKKIQRYKEIINNGKIKIPTEREWRETKTEDRIEFAKNFKGYSFDEVSGAVFYNGLNKEAL
jgi:hypothetical protein